MGVLPLNTHFNNSPTMKNLDTNIIYIYRTAKICLIIFLSRPDRLVLQIPRDRIAELGFLIKITGLTEVDIPLNHRGHLYFLSKI